MSCQLEISDSIPDAAATQDHAVAPVSVSVDVVVVTRAESFQSACPTIVWSVSGQRRCSAAVIEFVEDVASDARHAEKEKCKSEDK